MRPVVSLGLKYAALTARDTSQCFSRRMEEKKHQNLEESHHASRYIAE